MNGLIRWYNTNRKKIWFAILVVIFIILLINVLNSIVHNQNNSQSNVSTTKENETLMNSISMKNDESTVSGQKISTSQKSMLKTLDEFASYCSDGEIEKAYELLSDDCKEEMYPTVDVFKLGYYDPIFNGKKKNISTENWINDIYKVKYTEDALSTGVYNDENIIQDFITLVIDDNGNIKLNINGYVGRKKINSTAHHGDLQINVVETNIYMDYQTYTFEITNNTDKTILLNDPTIDDSMYIEDNNETKYQAYTHEISQAELKVLPQEKKVLSIKYYSRYNSSKTIKKVVFSRIILDYEAYSNYQNIGYYNNYGAIQIKL